MEQNRLEWWLAFIAGTSGGGVICTLHVGAIWGDVISKIFWIAAPVISGYLGVAGKELYYWSKKKLRHRKTLKK